MTDVSLEAIDPNGLQLRLSGQRAFWGNVPRSLRAASAEYAGSSIRVRFIFDSTATDDDRELLSCAATEIISDYSSGSITEEYVTTDALRPLGHLKYLLFHRAE